MLRVVVLLAAVGAVVSLMIPVAGRAQQGPSTPFIAVFEMQNDGSPLRPNAASRMGNYLFTNLAACGAYRLVPQDQVRERLARQKIESYRECYDQSCQIELSREMAADKALSSMVTKVGSVCQVSASLYDLRTAAIDRAAVAEGPCTEDGVRGAILNVVDRLCGSGPGQQPPVAPPPVNDGGGPQAQALQFVRAAVKRLDEGKLDAALELLEKAYKLDQAPEILGHMAKVYDRKGDLAKAHELYERWAEAERDPSRKTRARERQAEVLHRMRGRPLPTVKPVGPPVTDDSRPLVSSDSVQALKPGPGRGKAVEYETDWVRISAMLGLTGMWGGRLTFIGLKFKNFYYNVIQGGGMVGVWYNGDDALYAFAGGDLGWLWVRGRHQVSVGTLLAFGVVKYGRDYSDSGSYYGELKNGAMGFGFGPIVRYRHYWYAARCAVDVAFEFPMVVGEDEGGEFSVGSPIISIGIGM